MSTEEMLKKIMVDLAKANANMEKIVVDFINNHLQLKI